jgi:Protein of unknown function (DUF968)
MTLRQKEPRVKDAKHLQYIRGLACCVCGDNTSTEAAHIRSGSINHGKRSAGMSEKSSDAWCLPLCGRCHREQHAFGDELKWWASKGIDPFMLAITLKAAPPRCEGCDSNYADPPSKLCPGCQAYKEHQS